MTSNSIYRFLPRIFAGLSLILALYVPYSVVAETVDIELERVKAIELLKQAQEVNPNPWYAKTEKILRRMNIVVQSHAYATCLVPNTAAFTDWTTGRAGDRDVYVCPPLVTAKYRHAIPTTLIHEAVHVMGYYDECPAEKVEISVQNDLGLKVVNSTYPHCKIPTGYRISSAHTPKVGRAARPAPRRQAVAQPFYAPAKFNFGRGF